MNKRILIALAAVMLVFGLAGCAEDQIPYLTDEQMKMMGEFTAITLMRYDANHRSRLVDYTLLLEPQKPETAPEPEQTKEPAGMDPVDDTPVIGVDGQVGGAGIEKTLEFPEGVNVTFTGQALYDIYPEAEDGFAITATQGTKLLVLSFSIFNDTQQAQSFDLLAMEPRFSVIVNRNQTYNALRTVLENDFAAFQNTIPAGESAIVELVVQLDTEVADNITSISLKIKNNSRTGTVRLF